MKPKPLSLQAFIASLDDEQKTRFAKLADTTVPHLAQLSGGHRRASPELARRLTKASRRIFRDEAKQLVLAAVRPDIWGEPRRKQSKSISARV